MSAISRHEFFKADRNYEAIGIALGNAIDQETQALVCRIGDDVCDEKRLLRYLHIFPRLARIPTELNFSHGLVILCCDDQCTLISNLVDVTSIQHFSEGDSAVNRHKCIAL